MTGPGGGGAAEPKAGAVAAAVTHMEYTCKLGVLHARVTKKMRKGQDGWPTKPREEGGGNRWTR